MFQDRDSSLQYVRRRKSKRSSSMMMFAMAAALLITGGALGTPWLTEVFGESNHVSAANEAGVSCPPFIVGLTLIDTDGTGEIYSDGDLFELDCNYVLEPSTTVSAAVHLTWTENGTNQLLQRGCGLPPTTVPGVFTSEGSYYGIIGQARADYTGQQRYANAMQGLALNLVSAAASVAEPCPDHAMVTNPDNVSDGTPSSAIETIGPNSSGSPINPVSDGTTVPSGQQATTPVPTHITGAPGSQGTSTVTTVQVPVGSCLVHGRVTDSRGTVVPYISISIFDAEGSLSSMTATSESGRYTFFQPVETGGSVVLTPTDGGRPQEMFQIHNQQLPSTLARPLSGTEVGDSRCEANFEFWSLDDSYTAVDSDIERWPSIIELYQNFNRAAELADVLGAPMDYGLPLPVYAWCDSTELFCDPTGVAEFAFYSGSTTGREITQPYIALGFPSSDISYRGTPDNREYHEFGHAFLADVVGNEIPVEPGDSNHGGYYRNMKTTDSLIEGFAEFYSVMVSKHIDMEDAPQRYKIGAEYDIEADRKPWEAVGWWEEFTLAGLLLDFEDGSADYVPAAHELDVESVSALTAETGNFAIGRVRNMGGTVARGSEVTVNLLDGDSNIVFTQVTAVKPDSLGPGQTGIFYVAAPSGMEFADVAASPGRPAGTDDDEIDLTLQDLMRVLTSNWGADQQRISTVEELYTELSGAFADEDMDDDGTIDITQAQIDAIFIQHGFFDDIDGDRQFNAATDGNIGGSAHPEATISRQSFPAIVPRSSAVSFDGAFADIDTAGIDADLLVQIEMADTANSYSYWANSGTNAPVELAVPAADSNASAVTVLAIADGHEPAIAYRTTAQQFHSAVESGEIRSEPVRSAVQLREGNPLAILGSPGDGGEPGSGNSPGGMPPWTMLLPVGMAGVMLAGGVYFMRRSSQPATGANGKD